MMQKNIEDRYLIEKQRYIFLRCIIAYSMCVAKHILSKDLFIHK